MPKLSAYLAQAEAVSNEKTSKQTAGSTVDIVTGRFQALHAKRSEKPWQTLIQV